MARLDVQTTPILSGQTANVVGNAFGQLGNFQAGAPNLLNLYQNFPGLSVPNLTPEQQALINQITAFGANNPDLANARAAETSLTAGPIGSSPLTQQAMQAWEQFTKPTVESSAALAGLGNSGALAENLAGSETQALVPLLQQEIQNRQGAVSAYTNIQQQQINSLASALEASGLPRQVALEQAQAAYQQATGQSQFAAGLQQFPLSVLSQLIGTQQTSHSTPGAWDYVGGITKGLEGPVGSLLGGG